jgi:hypothetical protein
MQGGTSLEQSGKRKAEVAESDSQAMEVVELEAGLPDNDLEDVFETSKSTSIKVSACPLMSDICYGSSEFHKPPS